MFVKKKLRELCDSLKTMSQRKCYDFRLKKHGFNDCEICERPLRIGARQKSSYGLIMTTSVKGSICRASSVTMVAEDGVQFSALKKRVVVHSRSREEVWWFVKALPKTDTCSMKQLYWSMAYFEDSRRMDALSIQHHHIRSHYLASFICSLGIWKRSWSPYKCGSDIFAIFSSYLIPILTLLKLLAAQSTLTGNSHTTSVMSAIAPSVNVPTCYSPNQSVVIDNYACNLSANVSACCSIGSTCLDNKIC